MKKMLFVFLLTIAAQSTFACTEEAQFVSVVKKVTPLNSRECLIELNINLNQANQSYNPSLMCPLDIGEVYDHGFVSSQCDYKVGDQISGYLVKNDNTIYKD